MSINDELLENIDWDAVIDALLGSRPDRRFYLNSKTGDVVDFAPGEDAGPDTVEIPVLSSEDLTDMANEFLSDMDTQGSEFNEAREWLGKTCAPHEWLDGFSKALTKANQDVELEWQVFLDEAAFCAAEQWVDTL